jgi:hypothetical protein
LNGPGRKLRLSFKLIPATNKGSNNSCFCTVEMLTGPQIVFAPTNANGKVAETLSISSFTSEVISVKCYDSWRSKGNS